MSGRASMTVRRRVVRAVEVGDEDLDAHARAVPRSARDGLREDPRAAVGQVVAGDAGDDDMLEASAPTASATRRGSSSSYQVGRPVLTAQKPQARVQVSPRIMIVAVRWSQHSPMFGQRASSQTVLRSGRGAGPSGRGSCRRTAAGRGSSRGAGGAPSSRPRPGGRPAAAHRDRRSGRPCVRHARPSPGGLNIGRSRAMPECTTDQAGRLGGLGEHVAGSPTASGRGSKPSSVAARGRCRPVRHADRRADDLAQVRRQPEPRRRGSGRGTRRCAAGRSGSSSRGRRSPPALAAIRSASRKRTWSPPRT